MKEKFVYKSEEYMAMWKKLIVLILIISFCPMQAVFAADDLEESIVRSGNVFKNNYQNTKEDSNFSNLSQVEKIFNKKESVISGTVLRQIGYNFNALVGSSVSTTGKYGRDYKLSVGEKINIYSYGDSVDIMSMSGNNLLTPMTKADINSNGMLFVSGIGLIHAENRTLGEVEDEINKLAKGKYQNLNIKLTVATGTEFSVFVYGEVNKPGKIYIGNNSSVLDALSAAGGVKKTGTLRNITYNNAHIDLYKTLFLGHKNNVILKPNDTIFVDKIGDVVAVKNGVKVPGIYEIRQGETVKDLIKYAGDLLPNTESNEIVLIGFDAIQGQKVAQNLSLRNAKNTKLVSGDTIEFKELYNGVENIVTIQGNIKHPATIAYKKGLRLSDLLKNEKELLEDTFVNQAVIRRVSGKGNSVENIPVSLEEFFSGMNDPILKPQDVITVYRNTNAKFVDVYGCINNPKHMPYTKNLTLRDVLSDIKFVESNANKNNNEKTVFEETEGNIKPIADTQNSNRLLPAEDIAVEITNKEGDTRLLYMYDIMVNSDGLQSVFIEPEDRIFFRTLRNDEIMKTIQISGHVKNPGVYRFIKGKNLAEMIEYAGGLLDDADLRGIIYKRASIKGKITSLAKRNNERDIQMLMGRLGSGYKQAEGDMRTKGEMIMRLKEEESVMDGKYNGQISLNIQSNDLSKLSELDNLMVQDGDDIYIPRMSQHVSVIGEVYNEQSFIFKKGTSARRYVKMVGGYTPNANKFRLYKVGVNGRAKKVHLSTKIEPGDTIIVPRKIAGNDWLNPICEVIRGLASMAIMAVAITKW